MNEITLSSNWVVANEDNLCKVLTCSSDNEKGPIDAVTPETCICLTKSTVEGVDTKPELYIKSNKKINEIDICSEGILVEVFGKYNEYLFTSDSEFIDDWEGMAVYYTKISLPGVSNCKLKFPRIRNECRLWIYNIKVTFLNVQQCSNQSLIDAESIKLLINNSNRPLSNTAKSFKKFSEAYSNSLSQSNNLSDFAVNQAFLKSLGLTNKPESMDYRSYDDSLKKFFSEKINLPNISQEYSKNEEIEESSDLKHYINQKLFEIKREILEQIDIKLNIIRTENNSKINEIIKLLESIKTKTN